jgi:hypothetical protein
LYSFSALKIQASFDSLAASSTLIHSSAYAGLEERKTVRSGVRGEEKSLGEHPDLLEIRILGR